MIHFRDAMIEIGKFKRQELMKKQNIKEQLQQVEGEARMAIEMVPKRPFKPQGDFIVPKVEKKSKDLVEETGEVVKTRKK